MHLRPMQLWDIPHIADLCATTQLEDEILAFVAPHRHQYHTSLRNGFVRRIRARSLRPGWMIFVAETDEGDEPTTAQKERGENELGGRVVGYAAWLRAGESAVARNWQRINEAWFTRIESYLAELTNRYWSLFRLDWSEDPSKRESLLNLFEQTFDKAIFSEAWHLENAVVHKDYQRRGIGAALVKWGLDQSEAEKVPCCVESTVAGLRLYEKMGFRKFDDVRFGEKEKETFAEMVWEPSGMRGHWFDRAKARADAKVEATAESN